MLFFQAKFLQAAVDWKKKIGFNGNYFLFISCRTFTSILCISKIPLILKHRLIKLSFIVFGAKVAQNFIECYLALFLLLNDALYVLQGLY